MLFLKNYTKKSVSPKKYTNKKTAATNISLAKVGKSAFGGFVFSL
jgi:hypothetical protein